MRAVIFALLVALAAVTGARAGSSRIAGGSTTTINNYPSMVALLWSEDLVVYKFSCGGTILNNRAVLSAAHCCQDDMLRRSRFRVGSTFANSGGVVHTVNRVIIHPDYSNIVFNDIAILHTGTEIRYNNAVRPGSFAGPNLNVPDNAGVWASGWGMTGPNEGHSEQLKHVQLWVMSQEACRQRWEHIITADKICVEARQDGVGQCRGDSGGPLYWNNIIVGVLSFGGPVCGSADPRVSMRVSRYIQWIQANA
ncbi:trypsin CFT-1-like [Anticarsia gemmatalis]|uniref:trypsin CFT-1-like n=1 Tax=Anticarsia gemmatalis TaxID=129554 RepID=UPI003F75F5BF